MNKTFPNYEINDRNKLPYYSLMFGIHLDQLSVVQQAIKAGAKVEKIKVNFQAVKEWENNKFPKNLVSLLEYAEMNSSPEVYDYLISKTKLDNFRIIAMLIKEVMNVNKNDEQIIEKMTPLVNKKNVNCLVKIFSFEKPFDNENHYGGPSRTFEVSALHMACYMQRYKVVSWLLELGANPNLWTKEDKGQYAWSSNVESPISLLAKKMENKGSQDTPMRIILKLLSSGADFSLKHKNAKHSGWACILSKLKKDYKIELLTRYMPNKLQDIALIQSKEYKIYEQVMFPDYPNMTRQTKVFSKYPVLRDISKHEKKTIFIEGWETCALVEDICKAKTLKQGLQKVYGFSSPRFIHWFKKEVLSDREDRIEFNQETLKYSLFFMKKLFLDKRNYSDFIDLLEKDWGKEVARFLYTRKYSHFTEHNKLEPFLEANFNESQIKELIGNVEQKENEDDYYSERVASLGDLCQMIAGEHGPRLIESLKNLPFERKNSFSKIHDLFVKEISIIEVEKSALNQEEKFPQLSQVENIQLEDGYKLVVAQSNHDLIQWGKIQGHCIGTAGYDKRSRGGDAVLLGIYKEDEPKYSMEISKKGEILQVQGKSHTKPPQAVMRQIVLELQKIKIVNEKENNKWIK